MAEKSGKFFGEFDWYMRAMKAKREKGMPYYSRIKVGVPCRM